MATVTFRFYANLEGFLPSQRRGRAFACACPPRATTRHMIEALGVPHTEVALLLVNGQSVGLDQRLEGEDRVAVYPKFERLDISPISRLHQFPAGIPRFVADAHLGGLARLLRMAGFDTLFDNACADPALAAMARREARILLTRDRDLLKHRAVTHGCYVHTLKPVAQLRELYDRLDLRPSAHPFSLCLNCNAALYEVAREQVLERLPPRVREQQQRFMTCGQCQRLYWEGSHWKRMRVLLASLEDSG
ncbi:Mut7-C ubiquitin/RNAse domain-containing protein [Pseudomonas sp. RIT-PI-S]|uniref:Mut7-C ubiquitin/RNAse domain-containing protein n=1 Tax=Pseudomonas sp. RIT-PI-S TaxID=3035295 RepID=UPI0021D8B488|nr:Mut7-C ubiquitin/RNAse domain-containing protein [Pseudomonas sp. RIT-PI-S]